MKWIATAALSAAFFGFNSDAEAGSTRVRGSATLGSSCNAPTRIVHDHRVQRGGSRILVDDCNRRIRHDRRARPLPRRVWVPPVYREVHVGYDRCGNHIHRQVLVRAGYWSVVYDRCR